MVLDQFCINHECEAYRKLNQFGYVSIINKKLANKVFSKFIGKGYTMTDADGLFFIRNIKFAA